MDDQLAESALEYHRYPTPGKISVTPTKGMTNQRDLALAYSPGVAVPCLAIQNDPLTAYDYTAKGNLVAVITNGTAVLGLGNIGAVAGKPVMEGKGCLFKKFAGIDVFDIEVDETDPDKLVEIIAVARAHLRRDQPRGHQGAGVLRDRDALRERMKIPVFHDDQHGTAIIAAAALLNGLEVVGKRIEEVKLVCSGAGAAAIACLDLAVGLGVPQGEHLGHRQQGRGLPGPPRGDGRAEGPVRAGHFRAERSATSSRAPTCSSACRPPACSSPRWSQRMARPADHPGPGQPRPGDPARAGQGGAARLHHRHRPLGLPEPGQQRPVLPVHLPRRARRRRHHDQRGDEARLRARDRRARQGRRVRRGGRGLWRAGHPLRARLPDPAAVRPAPDHHRRAGRGRGGHGERRRHAADRRPQGLPQTQLQRYVYTSGTVMQPVFAAAAAAEPSQRIAYAEGEDERVLRAVQVVVEERLARPVLIGRPQASGSRCRSSGLRLAGGARLRRGRPRRGADDRQGGRHLLSAHAPPRRHARAGAGRDAPQRDADRRHAGARGPGRRPAVRHLRRLPPASALPRAGHRAAPGRAAARRR